MTTNHTNLTNGSLDIPLIPAKAGTQSSRPGSTTKDTKHTKGALCAPANLARP